MVDAEYLGKKIEPFEMKMACVVCLATPVAILMEAALPQFFHRFFIALNNTGAHGLSEILYATHQPGQQWFGICGICRRYAFSQSFAGDDNGSGEVRAYDGSAGHCGKPCKEEACSDDSRHSVNLQCNVRRIIDLHCSAGWALSSSGTFMGRSQNIYR